MFKKIAMVLCVFVLMSAGFTGCGRDNEDSSENARVDLFSKKDTDKANEENTDAYINGEKVDQNTVNSIENTLKGIMPSELPDGFPSLVPIYSNAKIIEADTYGSDGYTVVYSVDASYKKVVDFYMKNIPDLSDSDVGESEAYFEGVDIGDVHINGLTISKTDDSTQVFITLRDYSKEADSDDGEDSYDSDDEVSQIKYDKTKGIALNKKYPKNIVPVYPKAKILDCSISPSGDVVFVELVTPPDSYNDVIKYYKKELDIDSDTFSSDLMNNENFTGTIDGWRVDVTVAEFKFGGNDPTVTIGLNK